MGACTILPTSSTSPTGNKAEQFSQASKAYSKQARRAKDLASKEHFLLLAAEVLIDNGQYSQGGQEKIALIPNPLSTSSLQYRLQILKAKESLLSGDAKTALTLLPDPSTVRETNHFARIYQIQADAYAQLDIPDQTLNARIKLETYLQSETAITNNHNVIWAMIEEQPSESLRHMTTKVHGDTYQGWLELALILRGNTSHAKHLTRQINNWAARFAQHPASGELATSLLNKTLETLPTDSQIKNVAILLPVSGKSAMAAIAIRDGLVATHFETADSNTQPELRFYDSSKADFSSLYQQAVQEGADLIIGPLNKKHVALLASEPTLPVPTLALNYSTQSTNPPDNLYQFGLLPEDEAKSASNRAIQKDYNSALILSSDDPLGMRLSKAFKESFEAAGGTVQDTVILEKDVYDYSQALSRVLHIDQSKQRHRALQGITHRSLKFEPSIRQDIDVIYLSSDASQTALIHPQLLFFRAKNIPLLASSRVYSGANGSQQDKDLNGIAFSDSTWAFTMKSPNNTVQNAIARNWPEQEQYARLYALGADALSILPFLKTMTENPDYRFSGNTGDLTMRAQNKLQRHLHWAVFKKGRAVLFDGAAKPKTHLKTL
jgi:outer membrane PBP1 activator LpoA protein